MDRQANDLHVMLSLMIQIQEIVTAICISLIYSLNA
jgi:hypothetical protein